MRRLILWLVVAAVSVSLSGCGWCTGKKAEEPAKKPTTAAPATK